MSNDHYPLGENRAVTIRTAGGRPLDEVNMDTLLAGQLSPNDLRIHAETLLTQAEISNQAGFERLSENLRRAAELTRLPNQELLQFYEALRPGRSTYANLLALAERLETEFNAPHCAQMFREAAEVYQVRRLLKE